MVHPAVLDAAAQGRSSVDWTAEPDGFCAAVVEAGDILRKNPDRKLADATIVPPANERHPLNRSLAARTLIGMVNASVERLPATGRDNTFECLGTRAIEACLTADRDFGRVIRQMRAPGKLLTGEDQVVGYQLITGERNGPLAVRKGVGEPSTLSFVDMTINGIPYPAGSILRAEILDDRTTETSSGYSTSVPRGVHARVDVGRVSHIAFRRLSAFAGDPSRRRRDFSMFWGKRDYKYLTRELLWLAMPEIIGIAESALQSTIEIQSRVWA